MLNVVRDMIFKRTTLGVNYCDDTIKEWLRLTKETILGFQGNISLTSITMLD
jgi:hypothetical protein